MKGLKLNSEYCIKSPICLSPKFPFSVCWSYKPFCFPYTEFFHLIQYRICKSCVLTAFAPFCSHRLSLTHMQV